MRYFGASGAVLAAAMAFSLTALGQTARAPDDKRAVVSMLSRNTIPASFREYFQYNYLWYSQVHEPPYAPGRVS